MKDSLFHYIVGNITLAAARARITVAVFCPFTQVGKRRGGNKLALKTGVVAKKQKTEEEVSGGARVA